MLPDRTLRGDLVLLRALAVADADDVFEYASDPEIAEWAGWKVHATPFDSLDFVERCRSDVWGPIVFGVELRETSRIIGTVDIRLVSRLRRIGEIGYVLSRSHWGKGFNLEAGRLLLDYGFDTLGLRRIRATCDESNQRSLRTLEKLHLRRRKQFAVSLGDRSASSTRLSYEISRSAWAQIRLVATACTTLS